MADAKTSRIPRHDLRLATPGPMMDRQVRHCVLITVHRQGDGGGPTELVGQEGEVLHRQVTAERAQAAVEIRNMGIRRVIGEAIQNPFRGPPHQEDVDLQNFLSTFLLQNSIILPILR